MGSCDFTVSRQTDSFLSEDAVREFHSIKWKCSCERYRFPGFLRFEEVRSGLFYAGFEPENDILELITEHFKNRFNDKPFVIHDRRREKTLFYHTGKSTVKQEVETVEGRVASCIRKCGKYTFKPSV
ncbi:MAG: DUF4130 domain-containing protein, partial [Spirochaetia bacterium]|nr:DUF4130 domain-containing protein [Spirochaetia bacterium]